MHSPWQEPHPDHPTPLQIVRLGPGQNQQLWLRAGSQLLCHAPSVRITESARWQAEGLVSRQTRLADGERLIVRQEGWIELLAAQGGEVLCLRPLRQPWHAALAAWLRRLCGGRPVLGAQQPR